MAVHAVRARGDDRGLAAIGEPAPFRSRRREPRPVRRGRPRHPRCRAPGARSSSRTRCPDRTDAVLAAIARRIAAADRIAPNTQDDLLIALAGIAVAALEAPAAAGALVEPPSG